jgi:G3E family GTPase
MLRAPAPEQATLPDPTPPAAIPVTLLTGFLGAGKTTLLQHVLQHVDPRRICIVENEFGAANIDSEVIETLGPGLVRRLTGCICCAVRTDLVATFQDLAEVCRAQGVDRVVVETTGMAEPAELVPLFRANGPLARGFRLAAVVTVADATHVAVDVENSPVAQSQVAVADLLVLNKRDQVTPEALAAAEGALRAVNPLARLFVTAHGACPAEVFLADAPPAVRIELHAPAGHHHGDIAAHLVVDEGPHDLRRVRAWVRSILKRHGDDFLRTKGFVHARRARRVLLQSVRGHIEMRSFGTFEPPDPPRTRLVVIGVGLDPSALDAGLRGCRFPPVQ